MLNDDVINDPNLQLPEKNVLKDVEPNKVVLVQDNDNDVSKDLNPLQKALIKNSQVAVVKIQNGIKNIVDMKEFRDQITSENVVDKKTAQIAIESFGEDVLERSKLGSFTTFKTKTNVAYLLRKISNKIVLEQQTLCEQCDCFFKDTIEAALHLLNSEKKTIYLDEALTICNTVHQECVGKVADHKKLSMPMRDVSGANIDVYKSSIASFKAQDFRQTNSGPNLQAIQDHCENLNKILGKKEIQAFLCMAFNKKPYQKNYLTNPMYVYLEPISFSDIVEICTSKDVLSKLCVPVQDLQTLKSNLESILGMYESVKNQPDQALEEFIDDVSSTAVASISETTANLNLLIQLPFLFSLCKKIVKEIS